MNIIIHIKNLRLKAVFGVNEWERESKQDVVINVELEFDGTDAVKTDSVEHTVDYHTLTEKIVTAVEQSEFYLLESLANHVLHIVMQDQRVKKARVEVDKPQALELADSVSVSCSAERL